MLRFTSSSNNNSLVAATNRQRAGHVKLSDTAAISLANALKSGDPRVQGLIEQLDGFQKNTVKGHGRDTTHQLVEQLGDKTSQMRASAVQKRLKKKRDAQPDAQQIPQEVINQAMALKDKVDANELSVDDYLEEMKKLGIEIQLHPDEELPATETTDKPVGEDKGKGNEGASAVDASKPKTDAQKARKKKQRQDYKAKLKERKRLAAEQADQTNAGVSKSNPFALKETTSASEESS